MSTATTPAPKAKRAPIDFRWRVVDIVVASVIGVASGLIFLLWNFGYLGPKVLLDPLLPGLQGLLNGPWLFAGVLGALIIRKPGAAIYTEVLAAVVSALVGNTWGGFYTIEAGFIQGLGAEVVFLLFAYANWRAYVALLAGAGAAAFGAVNDLILWFPGSDFGFSATYIISSVISGALIAGGLSWLVARGIATTGALNRFASGQEVTARV
jgi:energy-coupling factor transport system substrate-specific component